MNCVWTIRGSIPGRGQHAFSSQKSSDRFWPPTLTFNQGKTAGARSVDAKNIWSHTSKPAPQPICLHGVDTCVTATRQLGCQYGAPAVLFRLRNYFSSPEFHRWGQLIDLALNVEINLCQGRKWARSDSPSVRQDPQPTCWVSFNNFTDNGSRLWHKSNMQTMLPYSDVNVKGAGTCWF
jgi:hypothetical protein